VRSLGFSLVSWHFFRFGSAARHRIGRFSYALAFDWSISYALDFHWSISCAIFGHQSLPLFLKRIFFFKNVFWFVWLFVLEGQFFFSPNQMAIFFISQNGENLVFSLGVLKTLNFHKIINLLKFQKKSPDSVLIKFQ